MSTIPSMSNIPYSAFQSGAAVEQVKNAAANMKNNPAENKKLMDAAKEFESLFLNIMLQNMRKATPKYDMLQSPAQDIYQSMLDEELAKSGSMGQGMGIAEMIYKQFTRSGTKIEIDK